MRSLTPTSSPLSSPSKHGDRFIPSRAGANWSVNFHRINVSLLLCTSDFAVCPSKRITLPESKWSVCALRKHVSCYSFCSIFCLMSSFVFFFIFWSRKLKSRTVKIEKPKMGQLTAIKVLYVLIYFICFSLNLVYFWHKSITASISPDISKQAISEIDISHSKFSLKGFWVSQGRKRCKWTHNSYINCIILPVFTFCKMRAMLF